jgi:uncharacterized protein YdiU (UPF0061 family)
MTLFDFDNTYARELDGMYATQEPRPVTDPALVVLNRELADELGVDGDALAAADGVAVLAGNRLPEGATPIAQAYAGHQFGSLTPQLGDGRAVILGEHVTPDGSRVDIALKGSGRTPFSRGGDGRAALGPALREHVMGEAMHALGIPTTRSLAVVTTGESIFRDAAVPGAILTRVASSHLRIGTFQFFAVRQRWDLVARLVDYALARHDPEQTTAEVPALALLHGVAERQASLVAQWMHVGFIHGVMNTDNMTVSGETIDFGPCAFLEAHDPDTVFSSIDHGGRYAYGNQPSIARWNLARLAEALLPLIDPDTDRAIELAMEIVDGFEARFQERWLEGARAKLGLTVATDDDRRLAEDWLRLLHTHRIDHTLGWRHLADEARLRKLFDQTVLLDAWLQRWHARLDHDGSADDVGERLRRANPILVPRNHHVEAALGAAVDDGDLAPFERLLAAVGDPFVEHERYADLAEPAPEGFTEGYRTYCGT